MAFSSFKVLFSNYVKFQGVLLKNRHCSSALVNIFRTSTTLTDLEKPPSINRVFQNSSETLTIDFKDSITAKFHYIWLRDNCNCNKCVHPRTKQKLLDTVSLNLDIVPNKCHLTSSGILKIAWNDRHREHYSYYDPSWLHKYALGFYTNAYEGFHDILPPIVCWDGKFLDENLPQIQYEEVMHSQEGIYLTLEKIHEFGILFVKNVPQEPGEVVKLLNRIAHVKSTRWGTSYHITTNDIFDDPAYFPYTGEKIDLQTDMNYLQSSPGVQVVHCLQATTKNIVGTTFENLGGTFFVDGFYIADWLRKHYPLHFEILVSVPVKFRMCTQNMQYMNYQPILKLNRCREVTEVHYNNRMMAPLEGPATRITDFYAARKVFGESVRKRENQFRKALQTGDIVIINNRRVLHGRQIFDPRQIKKHLEGCYADVDDVVASYRAFLRKKIHTEG